jgi:predicted dehydrogenase
MINKGIWIVGSGLMGIEYAKVLNALNAEFITIGRGQKSCSTFNEQTGNIAISGGLVSFLETKPVLPQAVIVSVGIEALTETTLLLLNYGVKYILLEKPGVGYPAEIRMLTEASQINKATILLAYNRRFYASVLKAEEIIVADGGVSSFNFEFTEWSHIISTLTKHPAEHQNWFLGNSTHVIDTAFFLGGIPKELCAFYKGTLDWHKSSSNFAGAGVSEKNALFSYHANWEAPGRWVIEILTRKNRLIFKPMESLQIQVLGSVAVNPIELDDQLDKDFKPGFYLQTKEFLENKHERFCKIEDQLYMIDNFYNKMSGYTA